MNPSSFSPDSSSPRDNHLNHDNDTLNMQVRLPNGDKVPLLVDVNATVADLRVLIYAATNIPEHRQKLVYAGTVIQPNIDDTDQGQHTPCSQFNFRSGTTIYLIVLRDDASTTTTPISSSSPSSSLPSTTTTLSPTSTTTPAKLSEINTGANNNNNNLMQNPLASLLNANPMMDMILNNPDFLHSMVMQDPRMRELSQSNPDIARMLSDPDFLRQLIRTSSNPAALREMQRTQDRALANLETIPGGFMALQRMYSQTAGALDDAMMKPIMTNKEEELRSQHLASALGVKSVKPGSLNTQALPNPWAGVPSSSPPSSSSNNNNHLGMVFPPGFSMPPFLSGLQQSNPIRSLQQNTGTQLFSPSLPNNNNNNNNNNSNTSSSTLTVPPITEDSSSTHHPYMTQLNHMVDMGFDRNVSARYLMQTSGNIDMAVDMVVAALMEEGDDNNTTTTTHDG